MYMCPQATKRCTGICGKALYAFLAIGAVAASASGIDHCCLQDDASPEALAQNALAVALSALLIWGFGSILWKLAVVSYALFAAAFRYSFVAFVLLVVVVFLAA